jgi:outer membrane immunogenic protein
MKYLFAASAAALAFAAPVTAQESRAESASGLRAEGRVGLDINEVSLGYDDGIDSFEASDSQSDFGYGAEIGYDIPVGQNFVIGGYVGVDLSSARYCSEFLGDDELCIDAGRNFTVGARAGFPISEGSLVYAKGGYSNGRINVSYDEFGSALNDVDEGENMDGFHLGAGVEVGINQNLYLKSEYVFTDYQNGRAEEAGISFGAGLTRHQIMAGVGFRF